MVGINKLIKIALHFLNVGRYFLKFIIKKTRENARKRKKTRVLLF